jgi:hypothetical protein
VSSHATKWPEISIEGDTALSLQTIAGGGVAGRLHSRREGTTAVVQPRPTNMTTLLSGASMRVLETGLAAIAIATALLIGLGR